MNALCSTRTAVVNEAFSKGEGVTAEICARKYGHSTLVVSAMIKKVADWFHF